MRALQNPSVGCTSVLTGSLKETKISHADVWGFSVYPVTILKLYPHSGKPRMAASELEGFIIEYTPTHLGMPTHTYAYALTVSTPMSTHTHMYKHTRTTYLSVASI